jgi:DNA-binding MarR family transcriptional regulator
LGKEPKEEHVGRLEEAFNRLVRYLAAAVSEQQDVAPGPVISGSQRIVLRSLASNGPHQVSEVAAELGVTLSAATGLVDRMVKAKWVLRDRDQKDRRVVWVNVTPEGETVLRAAEARRRAALSRLVEDLPEDELAKLCDILEHLGSK